MHIYNQTTRTMKMTGISTNYLKKIQEATALDEQLRANLVEFHENMGFKTPYLLKMDNPRLTVSTSWHNTIMAALFEARILTGNFNIHFYERILTLQECEAIRSCENGELDPHQGCSIERSRETRALREKELEEERNESRECDSEDEDDALEQLLEQVEHDEELQEMFELAKNAAIEISKIQEQSFLIFKAKLWLKFPQKSPIIWIKMGINTK